MSGLIYAVRDNVSADRAADVAAVSHLRYATSAEQVPAVVLIALLQHVPTERPELGEAVAQVVRPDGGA